MQLTVNGEAVEAKSGSTVAALLEQLNISRERVAVEINMEIVPKATYGSHCLSDGDRIEIVQFVGGG